MIKKERLQELIEQNATIYFLAPTNEIIEIHCNNNAFIGCYDNMFHFRNNYYNIDANFTSLFETKEEAEWHKEFGCIERTERLELPTWEQFDKSEKLVRFIGKNGGKCKLEGYFNLDLQSGFIDVVENGSSQLSLSEYTKENYTLACRKAKELFLGEKEC